MRRKTMPVRKAVKSGNISIVLVEPQSSGNVGSVARAMKNTAFTDLALVNPCDYMNNEAYSMACKADDVLRSARVFSTLDECIKETGILVGTTRRMGRLRYPLLTLHEAVPKIIELAAVNRVSILFGREDKGLKNEEIPLCDMLIEIPTNPDYGSLNLAQAVMIVCYHLFIAKNAKAPAVAVAPKEEVAAMYVHLEEALRALSYGDKGGEHLLETIIRSFRRLLGRTGLMQKEVNMLRGIFTQINNRMKR